MTAAVLFAATAAASPAITVGEAVRTGLANDPDLRSSRAREGAAETDVSIAKGGYYPSLSVSGGPRSTRFDGFSYDVTATQMLYDWGRTGSGVRGARAAQRRIAEEWRKKEQEAALAIAETYLDILVTSRQIEALEGHVADLESIREMTLSRNEGGYSDRSELERAELELARAREQLTLERGTLLNARNEFALLVGQPATGITEPAPTSVMAYVAQEDLDTLIESAPAFRMAVEETQSAEASLGETRSALLPQINLEGSVTRKDVGGIPRDDSAIALRFRMPTIQGTSNFQRSRGARQRVEAAILAEQAVARELKRELQRLFDRAELQPDQEAALEAQVASSKQVSDTYLEQFQIGRRDVLDLLNTRRENFEARRQLINARIDRFRLEYRAAARLGLITDLLEKERN